MSKVALSGNASGTGTLTIAAPNTSTDRTLNLPDSNGTILTTATPGVPVNGPAFSAYQNSTQTLSNLVETKITFDIEEFDTASCFASSRFTPNVAGYYQVNSCVTAAAATSNAGGWTLIRKNGATVKAGGSGTGVTGQLYGGSFVSALIYMNGSTDYLEIYFYGAGQASTFGLAANAHSTYFQAFLARSAT